MSKRCRPEQVASVSTVALGRAKHRCSGTAAFSAVSAVSTASAASAASAAAAAAATAAATASCPAGSVGSCDGLDLANLQILHRQLLRRGNTVDGRGQGLARNGVYCLACGLSIVLKLPAPGVGQPHKEGVGGKIAAHALLVPGPTRLNNCPRPQLLPAQLDEVTCRG